MLESPVLVGVFEQGTAVLPGAVHDQALGIRAGRGIGEAETVLDVEACAVIPDDAGVGPEETLPAVGETVAHAVDADGDGEQAGDEMDEVYVMAADVSEGVGMFGGHPVLEIGVAVIPFLEQAGGTQTEFAERALSILAAGHQAAVVEPFVVFDGDEQAAGAGLAGDFFGVGGFQREGLHAEDMLVVRKGGHDHLVVKLIRHGDYYDLARGQGGNGLEVEIRLGRGFAIGPGMEGLGGEGPQ